MGGELSFDPILAKAVARPPVLRGSQARGRGRPLHTPPPAPVGGLAALRRRRLGPRVSLQRVPPRAVVDHQYPQLQGTQGFPPGTQGRGGPHPPPPTSPPSSSTYPPPAAPPTTVEAPNPASTETLGPQNGGSEPVLCVAWRAGGWPHSRPPAPPSPSTCTLKPGVLPSPSPAISTC